MKIMNSMLRLVRVNSGNPFADHPALLEIFGERSVHVKADTVADLLLGAADPYKNHVYLMLLDDDTVVGITGFFQPDVNDATTLALRWHGVIPAYRRRRYSEMAFEIVRQEAIKDNPSAQILIEIVPQSDALEADKLMRYFRTLRFRPVGVPKDATEFPASAALPEYSSGKWQVMHHTLAAAPKARFVGKFLFE